MEPAPSPRRPPRLPCPPAPVLAPGGLRLLRYGSLHGSVLGLEAVLAGAAGARRARHGAAAAGQGCLAEAPRGVSSRREATPPTARRLHPLPGCLTQAEQHSAC